MPGRLSCTFHRVNSPRTQAVFHLAQVGACSAASYCALSYISNKPLTGLGADEHGAASPQALPHSRRAHQQTSREGGHQHLPMASNHQLAPGVPSNYSQSSCKLPGAGKQMLTCCNRLKASGWLREKAVALLPCSVGLHCFWTAKKPCMCRAGSPAQQAKGAWLGPQP